MLTYLAAQHRQANPLDFDNRSLLQAANSLLGKSRTDALLKAKGPKGALLLLGALEEEAEAVRRNPEKPMPEDAHPKGADTRKVFSEEIQQWRFLHLNGTQEAQLPYRLRGENQRRALLENSVSLTKAKDGTENAQVQISLADLKQVVGAAESSGTCTVRVQLPAEDAEFLRASVSNASASLVFQDELSERPETKRAWLGNVAHRCEARAKAEGTLPADELAKVGAAYSGKRVTLARNGVITKAEVTETDGADGLATVEIDVNLPEISQLIAEKPLGGKGAITDGALRLHAGMAHGCNGRDFVDAAPELADSLKKNALQAAASWLGKETPSDKDLRDFLADYSAVVLTMRPRLRAASRLEPSRSRIGEIGDLLPGNASNPEFIYGLEGLKDVEVTGASCPACAGDEWIGSLRRKEIERTWGAEDSKNYAQTLSQVFGLENTVEKSKLIHSNFLQEPAEAKIPVDAGGLVALLKGRFSSGTLRPQTRAHIESSLKSLIKEDQKGEKTINWNRMANLLGTPEGAAAEEALRLEGIATQTGLDGGLTAIQLETFFLTEEMEEKFQSEKELRDQEIFDSKSETATDEETGGKKDKIDKADWVESKGTITLELPAEGAILHRLKRYNASRTGLGTSRNKAERMDADISMPRKPSARWNGKRLSLQDFLSEPAKAELEELMLGGDEWAQKEIKDISDLINDWQSSLRRLDPFGKNPMEAKVLAWMDAVAEDKADARCSSLQELRTLFGPSARNTGKIPYEREKTPDHLQMPVRSNPLPLKLLCGTGYQELGSVRDNAPVLWDMTMRWQCAARLQEDPLPKDREEARLTLLEQALADGSPEALLTHAAVMEVSEKPDTAQAYLEEIGLPHGPQSLAGDLADMADLIGEVKASPKTARIKGEETPLDDLAAILKENGIPVGPSPKEAEIIEAAVPAAISAWQEQIRAAINNLKAAEKPTLKDATISMILVPEDGEEKEKDPFDTALDILHTAMPQSIGDVSTVAECLLAHGPETIRVNTPEGQTLLRRGSGGTWVADPKSPPDGEKVATRVNEIEALVASKPKEGPMAETVDKAAAAAYQTRITSNVAKIVPAIETIPPLLAARPNIKALTGPMRLVAEQLESANKAKALAGQILKDWKETGEVSPWGWEEDITLNPMGSIEYTCRKIMGEDSEKEDPEKRNYYTRRLISEREKIQAADILAKEGKAVAASFLEEAIEKNMAAIRASAGETLPNLLIDLQDSLSAMVSKSHAPEIAQEVATGPVGRLIQDRVRYRFLAEKIRNTAADLAKTKGETTVGKEKTYEQVGRDIIPGHGVKEPVIIKASGPASLKTNKPWSQGWLSSGRGAANVAKRVNTMEWLRSNGIPPRAGLAFLAFCRHRNLGAADAIAAGNLTNGDKGAIKTVAGKFSKALESLGIDTQKHSLRTLLCGAAALHQYASARFARFNPWNPEWEKPLEGMTAQTAPSNPGLKVEYEAKIEGGIKTASPYKEPGLQNPDTFLETETNRKRLKSAARAVANLYKPVAI